MAPGEVTGATATAGTKKIDLAWTNPSDMDFDKILITWTPGDGRHVIRSKTTTSYSITGLTSSTAYMVKIQTVDQAGNMSEGVDLTATAT